MEEKIREEIQINLDQLIKEGRLQNKEIIVFTCTNRTQFIINYLKNKNINVTAVLDNDKATIGATIENVFVYKPEDYLTSYKKDSIILIAHAAYPTLLKQVELLGYKEDKQIIQLVKLTQFQHIAIDNNEFKKRICIVKKGEKLFSQIMVQDKQIEKVFICSPIAHIGDIYIIFLYFKEYVKVHDIKNIKIICAKGIVQQIAKIFGIRDICLILKEKEIYHLIQYAIFSNASDKKIGMLHYHGFYTTHHFNETSLNLTAFIRLVYELPQYIQPKAPIEIYNSKENLRYVEKIFFDYNLRKHKTVILFPYAKSVPTIKEEFWKKLVDELLSKGFTVCTNSSGITEPAIKGTIAVCCKLTALREFVEAAGYMVALRSGICDLLSFANAKKIVIYPYNEVRKIWSFHEMEIGNDIYELTMKNEHKTFDTILDIIGEP